MVVVAVVEVEAVVVVPGSKGAIPPVPPQFATQGDAVVLLRTAGPARG